MIEWRTWFDNRLDNAIEAAEVQNAQTENESTCKEHLGIQNDFNFLFKNTNRFRETTSRYKLSKVYRR